MAFAQRQKLLNNGHCSPAFERDNKKFGPCSYVGKSGFRPTLGPPTLYYGPSDLGNGNGRSLGAVCGKRCEWEVCPECVLLSRTRFEHRNTMAIQIQCRDFHSIRCRRGLCRRLCLEPEKSGGSVVQSIRATQSERYGNGRSARSSSLSKYKIHLVSSDSSTVLLYLISKHHYNI